ncbi:MAG: hypothetical protein ACUVUG_00205 [Candidatus Aminicenantia bacterium]
MVFFFLAIFQIDQLNFEVIKEIDFKEELVYQPFALEDSILLFFENKILRLNIKDFKTERLFELINYRIFSGGISFEEKGEKILFSFSGKRLKPELKGEIKELFEKDGKFFLASDEEVKVINASNPLKITLTSGFLSILIDENYYFVATKDRIFKLDEKGKQLSSYNFKTKIKTTFYDKDFVYSQTEDNFLECIRKRDLKMEWKTKVPSKIIAMKAKGEKIYMICGSSLLLCLKRGSGDIIWWKSTKERLFPWMELMNGALIISHRKGILCASLKDGTLVKKIEAPMNYYPVLYGNYLFSSQLNKIKVYVVKK